MALSWDRPNARLAAQCALDPDIRWHTYLWQVMDTYSLVNRRNASKDRLLTRTSTIADT